MVDKYKEVYLRIGNNVKKIRKDAKLTQVQLAQRTAKLDDSKISDIENAKEDYMFSTLLEVANGLGVDVEELIRKENNR